MSGVSVNWAGIYGQNNIAAQMMGDISFSTMQQLMITPLAEQIGSLQTQLQQVTAQNQAWSTLQTDATAVLNDLTNLASGSTFLQMQATSSNTGDLTAAADNSAIAGSYQVSVSQLASAEIDGGFTSVAMAMSSSTTALGLTAGTVAIQLGGTITSVAVTSSMSLSDLASAIDASGSGVSAVVEQAGTGGNYYLQMIATGTDQPIVYSGDTQALVSVGVMLNSSTNNVVQAAQPAMVQLGSGATVAYASNTVSGLIPGVTLQLQSPGSNLSVTVGPNANAIAGNIQTFVNDWNTFVSDTETLGMGTQAGAPTASTTNSGSSSFATNPNQAIFNGIPMMTMNQVENTMLGLVGQSGNTYQTIGEIGITPSTKQNGTLSVDMGTLTQALSTNLSGVQTLFAELGQQLSGLLQFYAVGSSSTTGTAVQQTQTQENSLNGQITEINNEVASMQTQAASQYQSWMQSLSQMAQSEQLFQALNGNSSNGNTGTGG